jgi:voltage-gated potassium channel Kch
MRTPTFRERLRYRFDAFMSRGTLALILGLFALSALLIVGVSVVIWVVGQVRGANGLEDMTLPEVIWASLLRTLDSGTMGGDTGTIGWLLAMLLVTLGGIFIVATLIGIISSGLEGRLDELRKGRSRVIEEGHTVILGWSRSIFTIVEELIEANANKRRQHIVILADRDKIEMEDELRARITDRKSTTIVCRSGSPIDLDEIDIASHQTSRAVIVLAPDTDDPDADVLKTLLAITNDPDRRPEPYHVVVELSDPRNVEVARMVGKDEVEIVLVGDLIARVTAQACRQPGLSVVYQELLDFGGDEIYLAPQPGLAGSTFGDALLAFESSSLIGLVPAGGAPRVNPPMDTPIGERDMVIAISADDDTIRLASQPAEPDPAAIVAPIARATTPERTLILGWNKLAPTIITELDHYLAEGSLITVVTHLQEAGQALQRLRADGVRTTLDYQPGETTSRAMLDTLDVPGYDHVILLSYSDGLDPQRADAKTLVSLLHLRDIAAVTGRRFSIVSEMLDVRNRDLAVVTRADDFIVSDRLVSLYVTQVAEEKRLAAVFGDIFDAEGSEIYLKPATDYVRTDAPVGWATVVAAARDRGEVAIGYRTAARAGSRTDFDIAVNPAKSSSRTWLSADRVIVIAED